MVFLGDWCCRYRRRDVWQGLDAIVARPYGLGEHNKDADCLSARAVETALFADFCALLNEHHHRQEPERYWRIVLGHWFRRCIDIIFNRTQTLRQCFAEYQPAQTIILTGDSYHLATQDSNVAIWASNDDRWNHHLFARLLNLLRPHGLVLHRHDVKGPASFVLEPGKPGASGRRRIGLPGKFFALQEKIEQGLNRNARVYVQNSYLPRIAEFRLQALLHQFPRFPADQVRAPHASVDHQLRTGLAARFASNGAEEIERIARALIWEMLPICFLEGFEGLTAEAAAAPWPVSPITIFTSNNFDTDEVFKLWAAEKVKHGARYVLGQHGSNYGTHRHILNPSLEEEIADQFLTWGWQDGLPQQTPAFIFKTAGRKASKATQDGDLLLIEMPANNRIFTWDPEAEFTQYFEDQKRFVRALGAGPKTRLNIRLHAISAHQDWAEAERWREFDPEVRVDAGLRPISELNGRLLVHSYDSTGILECFAKDVPMIAFWQNGLEHVRDSARPYYQMLVDAGLIHLSAVSAAEKVNMVWDDVRGWWQSPDLIAARSKFSSRYAVSCDTPARRLRQILDRA